MKVICQKKHDSVILYKLLFFRIYQFKCVCGLGFLTIVSYIVSLRKIHVNMWKIRKVSSPSKPQKILINCTGHLYISVGLVFLPQVRYIL